MSKLGYTKVKDYYLPNLVLETPKDEEVYPYGVMWADWIEEHCGMYYEGLMASCKINQLMVEKNSQAKQMMETIMNNLMEKENITEELKKQNQMLWVQKMNQIKHQAEETVLKEVVYVR